MGRKQTSSRAKAMQIYRRLKEFLYFDETYVPRIGDPFKTLIATVISARTRDEVTEKATENLFNRFPTIGALASANIESIAKAIYPCGFYKQKAKRIKKIANMILSDYGGKVPNSREELMNLPGVGRKTANIVLAYGFGIPAIPVDTHVHRISNRLGLVETKTPEETEKELEVLLPRNVWVDINWMLVRFGQTICKPVGPKCNKCPLTDLCDYYAQHVKKGHGD